MTDEDLPEKEVAKTNLEFIQESWRRREFEEGPDGDIRSLIDSWEMGSTGGQIGALGRLLGHFVSPPKGP